MLRPGSRGAMPSRERTAAQSAGMLISGRFLCGTPPVPASTPPTEGSSVSRSGIKPDTPSEEVVCVPWAALRGLVRVTVDARRRISS
ncbi:MAG: hypothetical protein EOO65_02835 [Methanosarcinales archaeon]|nr:MAG: hypothetical protein EOO65_02835 [Methanosarcinales archaeon]